MVLRIGALLTNVLLVNKYQQRRTQKICFDNWCGAYTPVVGLGYPVTNINNVGSHFSDGMRLCHAIKRFH